MTKVRGSNVLFILCKEALLLLMGGKIFLMFDTINHWGHTPVDLDIPLMNIGT